MHDLLGQQLRKKFDSLLISNKHIFILFVQFDVEQIPVGKHFHSCLFDPFATI